VIAMIGAIALFLFAVRGRRIGFAMLVVPAMAIAIAAGAIGGVEPGAAGGRVTSGFNPSSDPGNKLRAESFEEGLRVYGDASLLQKAIGRGAASTGNAQQLVDNAGPHVTVESYYLKLLVETGVVGAIMVGAFLIWAAIAFGLATLRPPSPWAASVAAAGLGLSLYNAIYPALETQILALVWWLLLTLYLKGRSGAADPGDVVTEPVRVPGAELTGASA
jgi:O-antigen ligase